MSSEIRRAGDPHRGGQAVTLIHLRGGGGIERSIVYKPRSLRIDLAYHHLVAWVARALGLEMYVPGVLDCGDHGWCEHVQRIGCETRDEVAAFYRRFGVHLCLATLLRARDVHAENVIARGAHPVIVDLECMLEPEWPNPLRHAPYGDDVAETMMLPRPVEVAGQSYDFSAFSADPEAPGPYGGAPMRHLQNRPLLGGRLADPRPFGEEVVRGFTDTAEVVAGIDRDVLARFAGCEVRIVLRPTFFYKKLLASTADGGRAHLWAALRGATPVEGLDEILAREVRDLEAGDVPIFTVHTGDTWLIDSRRERTLALPGRSGWELLLDRARRPDLARGTSVVREMLAGSDRYRLCVSS